MLEADYQKLKNHWQKTLRNTGNRMQYYFLDTSALVKRYHQEIGTKIIDEIFDSKEKVVIISNISISELVSALNRKKNEKEITQDDLGLVLSKFYSDVMEEFTVLGIGDSHIISSINLVLQHNLKALDSFQLAIALELEDLNIIFVSADNKLCETAKKEGLKIINPEGKQR